MNGKFLVVAVFKHNDGFHEKSYYLDAQDAVAAHEDFKSTLSTTELTDLHSLEIMEEFV